MNQYIKNAEQVLKNAEKMRGRLDMPCQICKHVRFGLVDETCANPIVLLAAATADDPDDGKWIVRCSEQRSKRSMWGPVVCGPNGDLWEPRPKPWWKLW